MNKYISKWMTKQKLVIIFFSLNQDYPEFFPLFNSPHFHPRPMGVAVFHQELDL